MSDRKRVLVAMSGGVDSSVAAALLLEAGYDVVGVFMRVGGPAASSESLPILDGKHQGCCSAADAADARRVAGRLGIPFYALNFEAEFSRLIDHFADEYARARTPNPCVLCNQWLKFGRLLEYADVVQAPLVATGHYARISQTEAGPRLCRAIDARKDQSYVLFGMPSEARRRTLFPLGDMTKAEVRSHAHRFGLALAEKPESQDICFVPDRDYAAVVRARRPDAFQPGEIRHVDGRTLGRHDGLPAFTIGQRHGLRVAAGHPIYVTELDARTNTVTVGEKSDVLSHGMVANDMTWWITDRAVEFRAAVRIRYNHEAAPAIVTVVDDRTIRVRFDEPQPAVTPGQAAVLYDGDTVVGGGWIDRRD